MGQSYVSLIALWLLIYTTEAFLFAALYSEIPLALRVGDSITAPSFWDALHFSLTTQSTVGYGDIRPINFGRWISHLQSFLGIAACGLSLGLITAKLINQGATIAFPDYAVYDPFDHYYWFRFISLERYQISNGSSRIIITKPLVDDSGAQRDVLITPVLLDSQGMAYPVDPLRLMALKTKPNGGRTVKIDGNTKLLEDPSPLHLAPQIFSEGFEPYIELTVTGTQTGTSSVFYSSKRYYLHAIKCGRQEGVNNAKLEHFSRSQKRRFYKNVLEKFSPVSKETCERCPFHETCAFGPALVIKSLQIT